MTGTFFRGLAAGAAGTVASDAVGYLDMVLRGRPASPVPGQLVDAVAERIGRSVPGRSRAQESRRSALAALAGLGNGLGVGVLASAARSYGVRFSPSVGAVLAGATSAAVTDVAIAGLGVGDPRTWSATDRVADAVPHLAYGVAVQAVLEAAPTDCENRTPRRPAGAAVVLRSALLGLATGSRSSLGFAGPILTAPRGSGPGRSTGPAKLATTVALAVELVADKQPGAPSRLGGTGLASRILGGFEGGARLATRSGANGALPAAAGVVAAAAGSVAGAAWRRWAGARMPATSAALLEDGAAVALAALACLPGRSRPPLVVVPNEHRAEASSAISVRTPASPAGTWTCATPGSWRSDRQPVMVWVCHRFTRRADGSRLAAGTLSVQGTATPLELTAVTEDAQGATVVRVAAVLDRLAVGIIRAPRPIIGRGGADRDRRLAGATAGVSAGCRATPAAGASARACRCWTRREHPARPDPPDHPTTPSRSPLPAPPRVAGRVRRLPRAAHRAADRPAPRLRGPLNPLRPRPDRVAGGSATGGMMGA